MKRFYVSVLSALVITLSVNAQEANRNLLIGSAKDNWFLGISGGVNAMYNDGSFSQPSNPAVAANIGKWFTPAIGFRAGYVGFKNTNTNKSLFSTTKQFNYNLAHLDAMWNIANTGNYKFNRIWSPILYIRGGAIFPTYQSDCKLNVGGGIGLINQFRLGKRVSLAFDLSAITTNEKAPENVTLGFMTFLTGTAGFVFDLGGRGFSGAAKGVDPALLASLQDKVAAAEKRAQDADRNAVDLKRQLAKYNDLVNGKVYEYLNGNFTETKVENTQMIVPEILYFELGKATLSDRELARLEYYAQNTFKKDQKLLVSGCADLCTGTRETNDRLSRQRAEYVKSILVNQFGYKAENIETKADLMPGDAPIKGRIVTIEVK